MSVGRERSCPQDRRLRPKTLLHQVLIRVLDTRSGQDLVGQEYTHPFIDRRSKVLPADYVTTTDGTGLVHTAPGHGEDDYNTGLANGLPVYNPVLANGRFDDTAPQFIRGLTVWEANPLITQKLRELGLQVTHSIEAGDSGSN